MRASYPGLSDQAFDGPIHDLYRAHHHDRHDRRSSYVFEDIYPKFDIAYGVDAALSYYQEMDELRRIIFGKSHYEPMGHEISREALRDYAVSLTRLGIMNFRFRGPGLPDDYDYLIRMVYFDPQRSSDQGRGDLPLVRSIVAAVVTIPWNENDPEEMERAHKAARLPRRFPIWRILPPLQRQMRRRQARYYLSPLKTQFLN